MTQNEYTAWRDAVDMYERKQKQLKAIGEVKDGLEAGCHIKLIVVDNQYCETYRQLYLKDDAPEVYAMLLKTIRGQIESIQAEIDALSPVGKN